MKPENEIQQEIVLEAAAQHSHLWRNNVGGFAPPTGGFVRYGLANESKQMNEKIKSSDLIGWTPLLITPGHVGQLIGVFTAIEVKDEKWVWKGDAHETAQWNFIQMVHRAGGFGGIANSVDIYKQIIRR